MPDDPIAPFNGQLGEQADEAWFAHSHEIVQNANAVPAVRTFVHDIEVGLVGVNVPIPVPMAFHSIGGWKQSLFGDRHMHRPEGVRFNTRLMTITTRWPSDISTDPEFVMPPMG